MAHPPYEWHDYAIELAWLSFFIVAIVFAFRSNIPAKYAFIALAVMSPAFYILREYLLAAIFGFFLIQLCAFGLFFKLVLNSARRI